jgi:hypothetical protein
MTLNRKKNLGIVRIPADLPDDWQMELQRILWVQDKVYQYYSDQVILISVHPDFSPLAEGEMIPEYKVIFMELDHIHFQGHFIYFERLEGNESRICRAGR